MLHETFTIELPYEELGIKQQGSATITTYIKDVFPKDQDPFRRPLIVICPGGGYNHHSPREGEAIAIKMLDMGYNAVVLRYSLAPVTYPAQLFEAAYTMKYVRDNAAEWDVDPVITSGIDAHRASFERSLGEKYDEFIDEVSIEKRVDKDTPPAFIWHTCEDKTVPLENSLLMVEALRKQEIPFDYHVYAKGTHGLGLGTRETATKNMGHYEPQVSSWTECFKQWMGVMYE